MKLPDQSDFYGRSELRYHRGNPGGKLMGGSISQGTFATGFKSVTSPGKDPHPAILITVYPSNSDEFFELVFDKDELEQRLGKPDQPQ